MKTRPEYMLRKVVEVYVILGIGSAAYAPNEVMSLNETGALLWRLLEKGADREALVAALLGEYDVGRDAAEKDVDAFLAQLAEKDLLEG